MSQPLVLAQRPGLLRDDRCGTCKFYAAVQGRPLGECHRMPPSVAPIPINGKLQFATEFPAVNPDKNWCGEDDELHRSPGRQGLGHPKVRCLACQSDRPHAVGCMEGGQAPCARRRVDGLPLWPQDRPHHSDEPLQLMAEDLYPTRAAAIMGAIETIQSELLPGDEAQLTVCAGPPVCRLEDADARAAGNRGCPNCTYLIVGEDLPRA